MSRPSSVSQAFEALARADRGLEIVQSVEKLQKTCIIKFAEHEMRIICTGDVNEGGIQVWS